MVTSWALCFVFLCGTVCVLCCFFSCPLHVSPSRFRSHLWTDKPTHHVQGASLERASAGAAGEGEPPGRGGGAVPGVGERAIGEAGGVVGGEGGDRV